LPAPAVRRQRRTLGIITAAVLKLYPQPREMAVALCAVASPEAALELSTACGSMTPRRSRPIEYMSGPGIELVLRHNPGATLPLAQPAANYVLVELATPRQGAGLRASLEELLAAAMAAGLVADAVIAESGAQRAALWRLREEHSEAQKLAGASVKNDVSVPVSKVPELIRCATLACERLVPGIRCVPFGHLGDGNIHFNLVQPEGTDPDAFLARDHELMDAVNAVVARSRRQLLGRARHRQIEALHDAGMARRRRNSTSCAGSRRRSIRKGSSIQARCCPDASLQRQCPAGEGDDRHRAAGGQGRGVRRSHHQAVDAPGITCARLSRALTRAGVTRRGAGQLRMMRPLAASDAW